MISAIRKRGSVDSVNLLPKKTPTFVFSLSPLVMVLISFRNHSNVGSPKCENGSLIIHYSRKSPKIIQKFLFHRFFPIIGQFKVSDIATMSFLLNQVWGRIVKVGGLMGRPDLLFVFDADEIEKVNVWSCRCNNILTGFAFRSATGTRDRHLLDLRCRGKF